MKDTTALKQENGWCNHQSDNFYHLFLLRKIYFHSELHRKPFCLCLAAEIRPSWKANFFQNHTPIISILSGWNKRKGPCQCTMYIKVTGFGQVICTYGFLYVRDSSSEKEESYTQQYQALIFYFSSNTDTNIKFQYRGL